MKFRCFICSFISVWSCFVSGCFLSNFEQLSFSPLSNQHNKSIQNHALLNFMVGTELTNVMFSAENIMMALDCVNDIIAVQCHENDRISFSIRTAELQKGLNISSPFDMSVTDLQLFKEKKVEFKYLNVTILKLVNTIAFEYCYLWEPVNGYLFFSDSHFYVQPGL